MVTSKRYSLNGFKFTVTNLEGPPCIILEIQDTEKIDPATIKKCFDWCRSHVDELDLLLRWDDHFSDFFQGGHSDKAMMDGISHYFTQQELLLMANGELVDSKTKEQISRCIESTNKPLRPKKKQGFPQTKSPGFVYLIQSEHGECKIGKTHDLSARLHNFHIKLPFRTELIHSIKTDDNISLERELHTRFNAKRINGEWFSLTQEDIDYIKNL